MAKFRKVLQSLAMTLPSVLGVLAMSGCKPNNGEPILEGREEYKVLRPDGENCHEGQLTEMLNSYAKQGWKVRTGGWGNGFAFIILARFDGAGSSENVKFVQPDSNMYPNDKHMGEASALFGDTELGNSERMRNTCVANLKQIEGAIEQCRLSGIDNPSYTDIFGDNKYIKNGTFCPLSKHRRYVIPVGSARPTCPNNGAGHTLP